jgi:hypothetical protein
MDYPVKEIPPSFSLEQLGTKEKFWVEDNQGLFKFSRAGTGEHWTEKAANELAMLLGLPCAKYDLACCDGRYGILSEKFVSTDENLIHGNEILHQVDSSYQKNKMYGHSEYRLSLVVQIIKHLESVNLVLPPENCSVDSLLTCFIGYLIFDAWIGNQDRHHENWGIIAKRVTEESVIFRLAPSYDHASSLAFNMSDADRSRRLETKDKGYAITAFASRAKTPFYSDGGAKLSTTEVVKYLYQEYPDAVEYWLDRLRDIDNDAIHTILKRIPSGIISQPAIDFSMSYLGENKQRLLELQATNHG